MDLPGLALRYCPGHSERSAVRIANRVLGLDAIGGVLVRLPWVHEYELPHIAPVDRAYVAAELNAFLLAWLADLPCRVINRPTPLCLSGPGWRPEQWIHAAARLGLSLRPAHRSVPAFPAPETIVSSQPRESVTVVGPRSFGSSDEILIEQTMRLSAAAGAELLTAYFERSDDRTFFVGADLWPDISSEPVATAVLNLFN